MIHDLFQPHYNSIDNKQGQNGVVNEYSLPTEFLIPYLAHTPNGKENFDQQWLLIRIRACYNKNENKSEIFIYQCPISLECNLHAHRRPVPFVGDLLRLLFLQKRPQI